MGRITQTFQRLQAENRQALIPFITAGDPSPEMTLPLMHALVAAGADVIELGMPFSDPMADGPAIQLANERALAAGMSLVKTLAVVREFRLTNAETPVVLMGYLNPVEWMGYERFVNEAVAAGVDGLLMVDMPPEETQLLLPLMRQADLDLIYLVTPTTTDERFKLICQQATGWIYYVSLKGITGANTLDVPAVAARVAQIKQQTNLPVCVGFGIKDANTAAKIAKVADGVIVGSVLVRLLEAAHAKQAEEGSVTAAVAEVLASMRQAMDSN